MCIRDRPGGLHRRGVVVLNGGVGVLLVVREHTGLHMVHKHLYIGHVVGDGLLLAPQLGLEFPAAEIQGELLHLLVVKIPDDFLVGSGLARLEVEQDEGADHQPQQDEYIDPCAGAFPSLFCQRLSLLTDCFCYFV